MARLGTGLIADQHGALRCYPVPQQYGWRLSTSCAPIERLPRVSAAGPGTPVPGAPGLPSPEQRGPSAEAVAACWRAHDLSIRARTVVASCQACSRLRLNAAAACGPCSKSTCNENGASVAEPKAVGQVPCPVWAVVVTAGAVSPGRSR